MYITGDITAETPGGSSGKTFGGFLWGNFVGISLIPEVISDVNF